MTSNKSYISIVKSTGILGGVQFFTILVSIIKNKFVAILLGPEGVGLIGVLSSTTELVKNLITLGIPQSAIRNIAELHTQNNIQAISKSAKTVKSIISFLGLVGLLLTIIIAPVLSYLSFGNLEYTSSFILLSITVLLTAVVAGQNVILQGTRKYVYLAKSALFGSLCGLILSIPLYYAFGITGIVPSLIISSVVLYLLSSYYIRKVKTVEVSLNVKEVIKDAKSMLPLGLSMLVSSYITILASYIIRAYLSWTGGLNEVGLFQAGFAIVEVYFGMIFTAMSTDYYPRLSGVANDDSKIVEEANSQIEIAYLMLVPLLIAFVLCSSLGVQLLYSDDFLVIEDYLAWASIGIYFKVFSFSLGYILFAKQKSKLFITTAIVFNTFFLLNNIVSYNCWGITGLGISYATNFIFHLIVLFFMMRKLVAYKLTGNILKIVFVSAILFVASLLIFFYLDFGILYLVLGSFVFLLSLVYSVRELDKRTSILKRLIRK